MIFGTSDKLLETIDKLIATTEVVFLVTINDFQTVTKSHSLTVCMVPTRQVCKIAELPEIIFGHRSTDLPGKQV